MAQKINIEISKKIFNDAYFPYLNTDARYLVFYGGAGSGKSHFIEQRYIKKLLSPDKCNLLVVRAVGNTNRTSTFALLQQIINVWNVSHLFKVNKSDMTITCTVTGNSVLFKGLDDTEKLKSITFPNGELSDIWCEEASEISDEQDFNQLDTRLRGGISKKQIVISFNPVDVNHWLKKRFFDLGGDNVVILHTTYKDNRFIDDDYKKLLESYKQTDPYYYAVYCLGQWGVYGKTIFDAQGVSIRLSVIQKPIRAGFFFYTDTGNQLEDIRWVDDKDGYILIYEEPQKNQPYVVGGDTAGEGSDSFTGQVINNITCKQVAVLKHQFDEDLYACQMYCLGTYYNTALIALEVNFSTYPVRELQRRRYTKLYVRETIDTYTGKLQQSFGFKTTQQSRPVIISELVKAMRDDGITSINDAATLNEMLTFVRSEKGRPEAQQGAHDDLIIGLAIAYHARTQQDMTEKALVKCSNTYDKRPDLLEDWHHADESTRKIMEGLYGKPCNY